VKTVTIERAGFRRIFTNDRREVRVPTNTTETWNEEARHCPYCGVAPVYVESGDGDYYVGPKYICVACAGAWTLQDGAYDDESKERAALIRAKTEATI
jgi:hypothetical protein